MRLIFAGSCQVSLAFNLGPCLVKEAFQVYPLEYISYGNRAWLRLGARFMEIGKILPQGEEAVASPPLDGDEPEFLFCSESMRDVHRLAVQVAYSDAPVLIYGESGTGKELFARLIHNLSNRRDRPYVPVNCGVLKGELFVDRFFGHEKGAFTGAVRMQKGSFESSENGTLFLDEVGEIPLGNQVDFLRVLEERKYKRLGGEKDIPFLARIVAATNRPLPIMVRDGSFRADLFYRLNVIPISLPALRDRLEEVPLLAKHFLSFFAHRYHKPELGFRADTLKALARYAWPGNVRELKNLVERLVLLSDGQTITPSDLPVELLLGAACAGEPEAAGCPTLDAVVKEAEMKAIFRAYKSASGNKAKTAEILQISPRTLRHKVQQYGLKLQG